jgi:hypothetical protein
MSCQDFNRVRGFVVRSAVVAGLAFGAVATSEQVARADVVVDVGPPAGRVEVVGRAPSPHHFWIPGYWSWAGGRHLWIGGRWEAARPGYEWRRAAWMHEGGHWRFAPGYWHHR